MENHKQILIACEESQAVCSAFRELGFNAYSCDIQDCSGGHPEWHIKCDVLDILSGGSFVTQSGDRKHINRWDLMIAHPPCTYLCVSGNRWFSDRYGDDAIIRKDKREEAIEFFMCLVQAGIPHIAVENPVGIMSTVYRKPDQYVHPYQFGDPYEKKTGLWLKNLPLLCPTCVVIPEERIKLNSGKTLPGWYCRCNGANRAKQRSKTFPGIAKAMATQWGSILTKLEDKI